MAGPATLNDQEQAALRWGGIAGILGSILMLTVFGFLAFVGGLETLDTEGMVQAFPALKSARIVENTLYLLTLALWILHAAGLFLALRQYSLGPALTGTVMTILGLTILATGAVPHTATAPIADLYHAPDATAASRAILVVAWQVIQGVVDALAITGLVLTPIGMGFLGLAMMGHPAYGTWLGWMSVIFGLAGLAAAVVNLIAPSDLIAVGIFALVFFNIIVGWRTSRLPDVAQSPDSATAGY